MTETGTTRTTKPANLSLVEEQSCKLPFARSIRVAGSNQFTLRGREAATHRAHNPKIVRSNRTCATIINAPDATGWPLGHPGTVSAAARA